MGLFFFDSHGALWVACSAAHINAQPFGPTGVAREATPDEVEGTVSPSAGETAFHAANAAGRVDHGEDGDFPVLV